MRFEGNKRGLREMMRDAWCMASLRLKGLIRAAEKSRMKMRMQNDDRCSFVIAAVVVIVVSVLILALSLRSDDAAV